MERVTGLSVKNLRGLRAASTEREESSGDSVSGVVDRTWQDIVRRRELLSAIGVISQDIWQISVQTVLVTRETRQEGLVRQQ